MLTLAYTLIVIQILVGTLDNLLHHELTEKLPQRASAAREIGLHGARELTYGVVFTVLAWFTPQGLWAWVLLGLMLAELVITLADFIEEDQTRTLPPFERVLHTLLAINLGVIVAVIAPTWAGWAAQPTALRIEDRGLVSLFLSAAALVVSVWGVHDVLASRVLFRRRAEAVTPVRTSGRTILITGATGFLGEALTRRLIAAGDAVVVLSRDPRRARALFDGRVLAVQDLKDLPASLRLDAIVNLAGAGVAAAPWTPWRKRRLVSSRLNGLAALETLVGRLDTRPVVLVTASAVGFYGDRGEEMLDETAPRGQGFTADLCSACEAAAGELAQHGVRVVSLRFGLILGRDGGAWPAMTQTLRFGLGARFGDGRQHMAWIHKTDALRLIETAIADASLCGPVNATAPGLARHGEAIAAAVRATGPALVLSVPARLLRLGLGEMACLFLDSQRVVPMAAAVARFSFAFPTIEAAAEDLTGRRKRAPRNSAKASSDHCVGAGRA